MGLLRLPQRLAITIQGILQSYLKMPMAWVRENIEWYRELNDQTAFISEIEKTLLNRL